MWDRLQRYLYAVMVLCICACNCITLFDKQKSYAMYEAWDMAQSGKLRLKFRTQCQYCLLLYIDDTELSEDMSLTERRPTRTRREGSYVQIALVKGQLHLLQNIRSRNGDERHTITMGEELNNLKWHTLTLSTVGHQTHVYLDDHTTSRHVSFKKHIAPGFTIRSKLYIGGLSRAKKAASYGRAKIIQR